MADTVSPALREAMDWHMEGRLEQAAARYAELLEGEPDNARIAHPLGVLMLHWGRLAEAAELLGRAVRSAPQWGEAHNNYGVALRDLGRVPEALEAFRSAATLRPLLFDAHNNLAELLLETEAWRAAIDAAEIAHHLEPSRPGPVLVMGIAQLQWSNFGAAIEHLRAALALDPTNDRARELLRAAQSRLLDPWHFAMMNEIPRNDAYDAALRRAVSPGALVLEIGTGSGLLAMMAARAGAGHVVTCEAVGPLAAKAREIVAHNGFAERVTVHHKRSEKLEVGAELPRRASVLVSELFDSNLLGEGVLASIEDAHARLLEPGAIIVPRAASAMIELAGAGMLVQTARVERCAGFDLTPFNEFTPERVVFDGTHVHYERFSEPLAALRFDFREGQHPPAEHAVEVTVTRSGLCIGVVQWLHIELDEQSSYENRPQLAEARPSSWLHSLYTFDQPVRVEVGQTLRLFAGHSRQGLFFRLAPLDL